MFFNNCLKQRTKVFKIFFFSFIRIMVIIQHIFIFEYVGILNLPFFNVEKFPIKLFKIFSSFLLTPMSMFCFSTFFLKSLPSVGYDVRLVFINNILFTFTRFFHSCYLIEKSSMNSKFRNNIVI